MKTVIIRVLEKSGRATETEHKNVSIVFIDGFTSCYSRYSYVLKATVFCVTANDSKVKITRDTEDCLFVSNGGK